MLEVFRPVWNSLSKWAVGWLRGGPHFVVGDAANPYLRRWYLLPRNSLFNIYLHQFKKDDEDRALHDHPWWYISIILKGGYWEVTDRMVTLGEAGAPAIYRRWHPPGSVLCRRADHAHRLEFPKPCRSWSLVLTGPRVREWGFACKKGWVPWHEFVKPGAPGETGRGCGD